MSAFAIARLVFCNILMNNQSFYHNQFSVCPSGWKEFSGNCYGFVPGFQSWHEANQFCGDRKVLSVLTKLLDF